ncbi:hypothetical protein WN55_09015 [Dufourea novaeangliae]|uniref:Uncharacterized protein n=1 Tax=Dufourea novaeangliae TaxID=178035 RepID=A0A154P7U5_DUFNO|nr:hypothetical protein WN55_09015 [Dufourea novaeangliae]
MHESSSEQKDNFTVFSFRRYRPTKSTWSRLSNSVHLKTTNRSKVFATGQNHR